MQNWFSGTPVGQSVSGLQSNVNQYQQDLNNWFDQTSLGQGVSSFNQLYDQRLKELQDQEQAKYTNDLTALYDSFFQQMGL